jgi:hypothetical protein
MSFPTWRRGLHGVPRQAETLDTAKEITTGVCAGDHTSHLTQPFDTYDRNEMKMILSA